MDFLIVLMPTAQTELPSSRSFLLCYCRSNPVTINVKGPVHFCLFYGKGSVMVNMAFSKWADLQTADSFLAQRQSQYSGCLNASKERRPTLTHNSLGSFFISYHALPLASSTFSSAATESGGRTLASPFSAPSVHA